MSNQVWKRVGTVTVDSGTLMVLDPGQLKSLIPDSKKQIESWYQRVVCTRWVRHKSIKTVIDGEPVAIGHMVAAGFGDGCYDVEVRKTPEGRIAELRIKFIENDN